MKIQGIKSKNKYMFKVQIKKLKNLFRALQLNKITQIHKNNIKIGQVNNKTNN